MEYTQMQLVHRAERVALCKGDARNLSMCKDNSADAIVTDPPYGLEFMGKEWDKLGVGADVRQPFRGELRTPDNPYGRSPVRYGYNVVNSGVLQQKWHAEWAREAFRVLKPGGHIIAFGGTRTYHRMVCAIEDAGFEIRDQIDWLYGNGFPKSVNIGLKFDEAAGVDNGPQSELAKKYDGYGTALKPAHEPAVLARKPLIGTVIANMSKYGTGAMNIAAGRVGNELLPATVRGTTLIDTFEGAEGNVTPERLGRFPSNIVLDEYMAEKLDAQIGKARFFYVAKPSRRERDVGLEPKGNIHPTVKPIRLMRYLCKLICPTGGLILDPFLGSGSTGIAALADGFRFLGVDLDDDGRYLEIAKSRIEASRTDPTFVE